jgi:hypothetical protein
LGLFFSGRDSEIFVSDAPAFDKLSKIILKVDGLADMGEIHTMLKRNERTLKHLILCGFLDLSPNLPLESVAIDNLTQLHLLDMQISHSMLTQIASAPNLQSLTLPWPSAFVDLDAASAVFASDRIIDGSHTLLPHLVALRFIWLHLEDEDDPSFYRSVVHLLRKRDKLRRLDLGACPWHIMQDLLPELRNLRALFVLIDGLSHEMMKSLVESIPRQMVAIRVFADVCEGSLVRNHSLTSLSTHAPVGSICWLFFSLAHTILPKFPD